MAAIARTGRAGIMAHLVAGFRSLEESEALACGLAGNGADVLEIQIPFSDPTADGPVITAACTAALAAGATPRAALALAGRVTRAADVPVFLMSYYNILFRWEGGPRAFFAEAAALGVAGLIVPDLPPDEDAEHYFDGCRAAGLHPVLVVSPNITDNRLAALAPYASGLVYTTARVGTTGAESRVLDPAFSAYMGRLRKAFGALPIAVGFGIRSRAQVEALAGLAELAVVGTQLLSALAEKGPDAACAELARVAGR